MNNKLILLLLSLCVLGLPSVAASKDEAPLYRTVDLGRAMGTGREYQTRIVFLGTGSPILEPNKAGQSIAIVVRDSVYVFDAGHGSMNNLSRYGDGKVFPPWKMPTGYPGAGYMDKLFLTHLDSDHVLDVPAFLLRFWIYGRQGPARVHGPPGTEALVRGVLKGNKQWIDYRLASTRTKNKAGITVETKEFSAPGPVFSDEHVRVSAFQVVHGSWDPGRTYGYRVETPDLVISITGDYSYRLTPALEEKLAGSDIVISEVMSSAGTAKLPGEWRDYMLDAHTTETQLAALMAKVQPRLLIGTHALTHGEARSDLLLRLQALYGGRIALADDNMVFR
ncbi:MBL fold metallo-hydrolase [Pseudomonas citronellolis]|uniref:MBL fold metallo-hydrolase n=1 Tax=Pseudomonas citronellolis TaxID=53408 RepID=UPI0021BE9283|nr:MBL fold metallo-hydrolase [Pseudomonas citronellolis]UXJ51470.1 MBL fold metallo-hydrolase [Pseudomonas citronellolis]